MFEVEVGAQEFQRLTMGELNIVQTPLKDEELGWECRLSLACDVARGLQVGFLSLLFLN